MPYLGNEVHPDYVLNAQHDVRVHNDESNCSIPDDCIDPKRYPLFMARAVLQELIDNLQQTPASR